MQRHSALEDFENVLSLTSTTFDNAHLMKARIHTREGAHALAHASLTIYIKARGKDKEAKELEGHLIELERLKGQDGEGAQRGVVECVASQDVEVRKWRAECVLAARDMESAVGDLIRLSHLLPPSTHLPTHIFRLAFFYLPSSPTPMATLKQCLHFDPDSKPCLTLHRLVKAFDKSFISLDELLGKEDWRAVLKLLTGPEAMNSNVGEGREGEVLPLVPEALLKSPSSSSATPTSTSTEKPRKKKHQTMPIHLPHAAKVSPRWRTLVRATCKAYTHLSDLEDVAGLVVEVEERRMGGSCPRPAKRFDNGEDPMNPNAGQGNPWGGEGGGHPFAQFFQQQGGGHGFL
ncbi:hypothetical protein BJ165DRAFT_1532439 [Panaeolus papilionaceus]|nr:hypothetical protein BJ165DRAFT_1532439 [Panaeolus papilionaceus]